MNIDEYLALFPGASRGKSRFMALAEAVLQQAVDLMALIETIQSGFSFATAEGVQLDAIAEAVGLNRKAGMTDEVFRAYLLQKLKLWTWDGTNISVPAVLPEGVTETDNRNGTVTVSPMGTRQDLIPVPAGVRVI
ncbi:MAG: DUF2612 domain-containing protein [Clostridia bacterium]|nr:DUF2612 domain-containing protein [Clostridia bacterium]